MAGSEERPSDEDSEWSDFSGTSSKTNTFDNLPFGLTSLDSISVLRTLISCFPQQSDVTCAAVQDESFNTSVSNDRS